MPLAEKYKTVRECAESLVSYLQSNKSNPDHLLIREQLKLLSQRMDAILPEESMCVIPRRTLEIIANCLENEPLSEIVDSVKFLKELTVSK